MARRASSSSALRRKNREDSNKRVGSARLNHSIGSFSPPREVKTLSALSKALMSPQLPPRSRGNQRFFNNDDDGTVVMQRAGRHPTQDLLRQKLLSPATRAHERRRAAASPGLPSRHVVRKQLKSRQRPSSRQVTPFPLHLNEDFRSLTPRTAFVRGEGSLIKSPPKSPEGRAKKPLIKFLQEEFQRPASRQRPPNQSLHLFAPSQNRHITVSRTRRRSFSEKLDPLQREAKQLQREAKPLGSTTPPPLRGSRFKSILADDDSISDGVDTASEDLELEGSTGGLGRPPTVARASPSVLSTSGGRDSTSKWMKRRPGTAFHNSASISIPSSPDQSPDSNIAPSMRTGSHSGGKSQRPRNNTNLLIRPPSAAGSVRRPQHVSLLDSEDDEQLDPKFENSLEDSGEAGEGPFARDRENSSDAEGLCNTSLTSAFLDLFGT